MDTNFYSFVIRRPHRARDGTQEFTMFDATVQLINAMGSGTRLPLPGHAGVGTAPGAAVPVGGYRGPERRQGGQGNQAAQARWLSLMLDEIDYGMLLLDDNAQVLHANHAARAELDAGHPLQLMGRHLRARHAQDVSRLHDALCGAASRGLRRLLALGEGDSRANVAVVPLGNQATLVVLSKRHLSERISVQCFATQNGLTPAETRVLEGLCNGLEPREIAELYAVGLATVRTQIGSIRSKTGAENIRALVRQVAVLPPMVSSLRKG
jgi:DNA-binding CsgD family transcriptional regulator